ncbi:MAG: hypothetical protein NVSMB51_15710 [Solirubrobacteraceae bacterium]
MRPQLLAGALALLSLALLSACESTQSQSARLAKHAAKIATATGQSVTQANSSVKILGTSLLQSSNGTAAVIALQNTSPRPLVSLPIEIMVNDAKGATVFKNDSAGLEPSLVQVPLLAPGKPSYWVNDQILGGKSGSTVKAIVGDTKRRPAAALPRITVSGAHIQIDPANGAELVGTVRNESNIQQVKLTVFGVAVKGGRVVAAGRAGIPLLPPAAKSPKPVHFAIFFIGDPRGAKLELSAPPTTLG